MVHVEGMNGEGQERGKVSPLRKRVLSLPEANPSDSLVPYLPGNVKAQKGCWLFACPMHFAAFVKILITSVILLAPDWHASLVIPSKIVTCTWNMKAPRRGLTVL